MPLVLILATCDNPKFSMTMQSSVILLATLFATGLIAAVKAARGSPVYTQANAGAAVKGAREIAGSC